MEKKFIKITTDAEGKWYANRMGEVFELAPDWEEMSCSKEHFGIVTRHGVNCINQADAEILEGKPLESEFQRV